MTASAVNSMITKDVFGEAARIAEKKNIPGDNGGETETSEERIDLTP
jgi:hypothetical protein